MKLLTTLSLTAAVTVTTALHPPRDMNINNLRERSPPIRDDLPPPPPLPPHGPGDLPQPPPPPIMPGRPLGPSFLNHQLKVDPVMKTIARIALGEEDSKPYADPNSKEQPDGPFQPQKEIVPIDEVIPNPLDAAEDEAPVDESTQTEESVSSGSASSGSASSGDSGAPKPKPKPTPLEKPAPGAPLGAPLDKPAPKPKPEPRSLFSLLGLEGPPAPGQEPIGKPAPKGKPMPNPPLNTPTGLFFSPFSAFPQTDDNTLLRAQMNLLSSPHSEDYSDEAQITIQSIQDYCSVDYATFCSPMFAMNSMNTPFGPSVSSVGWEDDDADGNVLFVSPIVNSFFDLFANILAGSSEVVVVDMESDGSESGAIPPAPKTPCSKHNTQSMAPSDRLLHESHDSHHSHNSEEHHQVRGPHGPHHSHDSEESSHDSHGSRPPRGPRPGRGPAGPRHEAGSSSESSSSGVVSGPSFFAPQPPQFVYDPMSSPSFLGYGQDGDVCLMAYYDSLSAPCRSAIDDAFVLRDQYVQEEERGSGCAFAAGVAGMLLTLATFLCCKRAFLKGRREKVMTTLKAIHNDPELKARVEAASGVSVPEVCCAKDEQPCRGKKCLVFALRLVVTVALSFLLVRLAAGATIAVANSMISTNEETGETTEPSPVAVLLIFISFLLAELLVVYGVKKCLVGYRARRQNSFASTGTSSGSTQSTGGLGRYLVLPSFPSTRRFSFFRSTPSNGYSPLMTDEESTVTEMIQSPSVVVASAPLQHQVVYLPPTMPVTAQSLSSVSMI